GAIALGGRGGGQGIESSSPGRNTAPVSTLITSQYAESESGGRAYATRDPAGYALTAWSNAGCVSRVDSCEETGARKTTVCPSRSVLLRVMRCATIEGLHTFQSH